MYRIDIAEDVGCEKVDGDETYKECLQAFMLWSSPMAVSTATGLLGFIAYALDTKVAAKASRNFGYVFFFLLFGLWCAASMAGAGKGLSEAFFAYITAALVAFCIMVSPALEITSIAELQGHSYVTDIMQKLGAYEDWFKGLFVITCGPIVLCCIGVSFCTQCFRRCQCIPCMVKLEEGDEKLWITKSMHSQLTNAQKNWKWTSVLKKAMIWGILFITLNVIVSKFTILFLSWLIDRCKDISEDAPSDTEGVIYVTGIIFMVGLLLFLLPPVPGVPIYLTGGIILVAAGTKHTPCACEGMGLVVSVCYVAWAFCSRCSHARASKRDSARS